MAMHLLVASEFAACVHAWCHVLIHLLLRGRLALPAALIDAVLQRLQHTLMRIAFMPACTLQDAIFCCQAAWGPSSTHSYKHGMHVLA
jgi:hypothetical protein